jgi:hypothetical protein
MEQFVTETLSPDIFVIQDVLNDNACFYRAIANLLHQYPNVDIDNSDEWGYSGPSQELFARELQDNINEWISDNSDMYIAELNMTVGDIVATTHNLSIMEYNSLYSTFAGDIVDESVGDRWGGLPEQVAISYMYKIPINIYTSLRIIKTGKTQTGVIKNNKAIKGVRFKLYQRIGAHFVNKPVNMLWKNSTSGAHYYALYEIAD